MGVSTGQKVRCATVLWGHAAGSLDYWGLCCACQALSYSIQAPVWASQDAQRDLYMDLQVLLKLPIPLHLVHKVCAPPVPSRLLICSSRGCCS